MALSLCLTAGLTGPLWDAEVHADSGFSLNDVVAKAKDQSAQPFSEPEKRVPDFLLDLSYDQWRDIRFKEEKTLWRAQKLPFEVQFFHPGFSYNRTVSINTIGNDGVKSFPFSSDLFDFGKNKFREKIPSDFGFAGFRILYPLHKKKQPDDITVFLGASYFRAVAKNQVYGLSARGLAIDTGLDSGEEFPYFKEFWIEKPGVKAQEITIYALLDSKRITGAYRFSIRPGEKTDMLVEGQLFRREDIQKIGIAPLTSMFFYGENINQRPVDDFRPEVHDSDGLRMVNNSGEILWRPLVNPQHLFINSFQSSDITAFGLLQRDRDFDHYQDQETRYDSRASALVVPGGDWGPGHVELVQIPTEDETNDNIVAYWVADQLPAKEEPIIFSYTLSWYTPPQDHDKMGRVIATRNASGKDDKTRKIIVDFKGGKLDKLPKRLPSEAPVEADINVSDKGEITQHQLYRIIPNDSWRLVFQVRRKDSNSITESITLPIINPPPLELRAHLFQGKTVLTETWSYAIWP
jgi:glucans biosynthesis protein